VYLVHGWGGRAEQLGAFVEPLVARGFRAVAFDGPAHGASAGRLSSGPEIGRALAAVTAQAGPAHAVIAHSLGAAATVFAMREGLPVARLAFLGAPANPLDWAAAYADQFGLRPETRAEMRRRSERRIRASWDDLPLVPLRGLDAPPPLLVVHDRDDREVAFANADAIVAAWPRARLVETSGLGHRRVLREPRVVETVTDFLSDGEPRGGAWRRDPSAAAAGEACAHGRADGGSACEACALEAELFAPALRRQVALAVTAAR
jgi:alpha-beta hydrolase superfamily lysophospholipase